MLKKQLIGGGENKKRRKIAKNTPQNAI